MIQQPQQLWQPQQQRQQEEYAEQQQQQLWQPQQQRQQEEYAEQQQQQLWHLYDSTASLVRLHHLLELADMELKRIEGSLEPDVAQEIAAGLGRVLEITAEGMKPQAVVDDPQPNIMYVTGPSGYDPQPILEKCSECPHYRLK
jgi:hypothetical protein